MSKIHIIYLFLFVGLIASCSTTKNAILNKQDVPFEEFEGGRFGYSNASIKLFTDSTFYYSEWNHNGKVIIESGNWSKNGNLFMLQSTYGKSKNGRKKSSKSLQFKVQNFIIKGDTLQLTTNDSSKVAFFKSYYTFLKVRIK